MCRRPVSGLHVFTLVDGEAGPSSERQPCCTSGVMEADVFYSAYVALHVCEG